jgi:hypothetical protein
MRFKTPAPLFNANGEHRARARRLFVYKSSQHQDPTIIDQSILSREVVVLWGLLLLRTHDREKSINLF